MMTAAAVTFVAGLLLAAGTYLLRRGLGSRASRLPWKRRSAPTLPGAANAAGTASSEPPPLFFACSRPDPEAGGAEESRLQRKKA